MSVHMSVHVCAYACTHVWTQAVAIFAVDEGPYISVCMDMCIDMCTDMRVDMCTDMRTDLCTETCACKDVQTCVRHVPHTDCSASMTVLEGSRRFRKVLESSNCRYPPRLCPFTRHPRNQSGPKNKVQ